MKKDQIVIVTSTDDAHADDMVMQLQGTGHDPIRLNSDDIPANVKINLGLGEDLDSWGGSFEVLTNGRVIDVDAIRSVWWRRPSEFGLPHELSSQEREFAKEEIDGALRGLWSSLDCYWVSHPDRIGTANRKIEQLQRAARFGFHVPRTLVTTDPEEALLFHATCGERMVFKVLTDPFLGAFNIDHADNVELEAEIYEARTTLITDIESGLLETVRLVPCMFQEYVPKQLELRITVIGDDIFAAEIHSQADERTRVDWRQYDVDIPYRVATLPHDVAERCLALVKSYHLNFSALDLILTPEGQYVFVENNPNGQFIFVEQLVPELRMTEALAACLIRGSNS